MRRIYIHKIKVILLLSYFTSFGVKAMSIQDTVFQLPPLEEAQQYISSYELVAKEKYKNRAYDEAINFYNNAIEIIKNYDLEDSNRSVFKNIANAYYKKQDYEGTILSLNDYLFEYSDINNKQKSAALHKLSIVHRYLGDLETAFSYELMNYKIVQSLDDPISVWESNYQLGGILIFQEDIGGALDYYFETKRLAEGIADSTYLYSSLGAIGNSYHELDSFDIALSYNQSALELARRIGYDTGINYSLYNIANDYEDLKEYEKALEYHFKALDIRLESSDKWGEANSYKMISDIYISLNNYPEALKYFEKGLNLGNQISAKPILVKIYEIGADLYTKTEDYELANEFLYKLLIAKEEMKNLNAIRKLKSQKTAYEISRRDNEINSLKNSQEVQSQKMKTLSYIGLAILPFIVLLLLGYQRLKKTNELLKTKTKLIEKQNIALEESNKELEQFAYVASHDMREPIRTISSFNSLLKRRYANVLGERGLEFVNFIGDASSRLDIMLTDLLDYSRVNTQNSNQSLVNLTDTAFSAAKNLTVKLRGQDVKLNVSNLPDVKVNPIQMERLFQNLIANGVKYNDKQEKIININYRDNEDAHIISVNDNGIGIAPEYKDKVFEIFRRLHGTSEYEGSGIGLATCKKIVERHNGEIWLDSKPTEGTTVYFSIPMHRNEVVNEVA